MLFAIKKKTSTSPTTAATTTTASAGSTTMAVTTSAATTAASTTAGTTAATTASTSPPTEGPPPTSRDNIGDRSAIIIAIYPTSEFCQHYFCLCFVGEGKYWDERYEFTTELFQPNLSQWSNLIDELQGKPVHLLEIGSYEGQSAIWLLENICTHPDCTLTTIDPFESSPTWEIRPEKFEIESRFRQNIALTGGMDQVEIIKAKSFNTLIEWNNMKIHSQPSRAFDFVYIDGAHEADAVLRDAILVWPLLKTNGIIIFNEYQVTRFKEPYNNPSTGIEAFIAIHKWEIEILNTNYQLTIRKVDGKRPVTYAEGMN